MYRLLRRWTTILVEMIALKVQASMEAQAGGGSLTCHLSSAHLLLLPSQLRNLLGGLAAWISLDCACCWVVAVALFSAAAGMYRYACTGLDCRCCCPLGHFEPLSPRVGCQTTLTASWYQSYGYNGYNKPQRLQPPQPLGAHKMFEPGSGLREVEQPSGLCPL